MQESTCDKPGMEQQPGTNAILIANPTSGSYLPNAQNIASIVTTLKMQGWKVELKLTKHYGEAARIAREAVAQKLNIVVTIGGDGTIHEVIQELAGSDTALGVLPCGTVNVWAREVGIPLDIVQASKILLNGQIRIIVRQHANDTVL